MGLCRSFDEWWTKKQSLGANSVYALVGTLTPPGCRKFGSARAASSSPILFVLSSWIAKKSGSSFWTSQHIVTHHSTAQCMRTKHYDLARKEKQSECINHRIRKTHSAVEFHTKKKTLTHPKMSRNRRNSEEPRDPIKKKEETEKVVSLLHDSFTGAEFPFYPPSHSIFSPKNPTFGS